MGNQKKRKLPPRRGDGRFRSPKVARDPKSPTGYRWRKTPGPKPKRK